MTVVAMSRRCACNIMAVNGRFSRLHKVPHQPALLRDNKQG